MFCLYIKGFLHALMLGRNDILGIACGHSCLERDPGGDLSARAQSALGRDDILRMVRVSKKELKNVLFIYQGIPPLRSE